LSVTDEHGMMLGIVTVDDAIDAIIPERLTKKLPRLPNARSAVAPKLRPSRRHARAWVDEPTCRNLNARSAPWRRGVQSFGVSCSCFSRSSVPE